MNNQIKNKAFTMIELMIVVAIISVLSIVLIPKAKSQYEQSKMIGVVKNKDLLETIVRGEYEKPTYEVETEDSSIDRVYKNLENNQDLEEMTNPFSKSGRGIGFIKGNTIEDTHKAGYILTEEPEIETLPKGTVYIVIKEKEVTSGIVITKPMPPVNIQLDNVNFSFSSVVLTKTNNTYVFGLNSTNQLGMGDTLDKLTPTLLNLPNKVKIRSISISTNHSLAIGTDENLYVWGNNGQGQLGTGNYLSKTIPTIINLPNGVKPKSISAGQYYSLAIGTDDNLYSWGNNLYSQLGTGDTTNRLTPTLVKIPSGVKPKSITAGIAHSLAIGTDGNLYTWGNNDYGQLGTGNTIIKAAPALINLPDGVKPIYTSVGANYSLVVGTDRKLYTWGYNANGQLGTGDTVNKSTPTLVSLPSGIKLKSISTGMAHSAVVDTDNNMYTWGQNTYGQLGAGDTTSRLTPTLINLPNGVKPTSISIGLYHSLVIGDDGNLYTWGKNTYGQLGTGDTTNRLIPALIKLPENI